MSISKSTDELQAHRNLAIQKLDNFLSSLINSDDSKMNGKADKLSYWLEDWTTFLEYEPNFTPTKLRRYKRGEIIKVHLGFNIGSEEGGLHYAVVLDKNNAKTSPVVTIIPLTSVKPHVDTNKLKSGSVFLGNELFTNLSAKISSTQKHLSDEIALLNSLTEPLTLSNSLEHETNLSEKVEKITEELRLLNRMRSEVTRMKHGSIALVNQITTISKIRIYDPKTDHDILSNIKLSNEKLDIIDDTIRKKFTNL